MGGRSRSSGRVEEIYDYATVVPCLNSCSVSAICPEEFDGDEKEKALTETRFFHKFVIFGQNVESRKILRGHDLGEAKSGRKEWTRESKITLQENSQGHS